MKNFKKIAVKLSLVTLILTILASCGGPKLLGIIPVYNGAPVTDTNHTFDPNDFIVIASYDDGTDKELAADEFEIIVEGMKDGYYILNIKYETEENECYIPLDLDIFQN